MDERREHSYIPILKEQFAEGKVDRREFLRTATLLGVSAGAAYAFVGKVTGERFVRPALANLPQGGTNRPAFRAQAVEARHPPRAAPSAGISSARTTAGAGQACPP